MKESFVGDRDKPTTNKQEIIDVVRQESPEKRVAKLIELGVLTDLEGYTWGTTLGGRFFVFANLKGIPIPMYRSSSHTGGKRVGLNFFVFLGVATNLNWIIKGGEKQVNEFYGIEELENVSSILTSVFDFDTSRRGEPEGEVVDRYVPEGKEILNYEKLNELLGRKFKIDFPQLDIEEHLPARYHEKVAGKIFSNLPRGTLDI